MHFLLCLYWLIFNVLSEYLSLKVLTMDIAFMAVYK